MDPLAEKYPGWSPYNYTLQNPIKFVDPDGRGVEWTGVEKNKDGTYTVVAGEVDNDKNIYVMKDGKRTDEIIGKSLTTHSFFYDNNTVVSGAVIDPNDTSGIDFLNTEIINGGNGLGLTEYMPNATRRGEYDFKTRGISDLAPEGELSLHRYRGMLFQSVDGFDSDGITTFASARDFGNVAAGYVAGRNGLSWDIARIGFDTLETTQNWRSGEWTTEGRTTQLAERVGFNVGYSDFQKSIRQLRWGNTPSVSPTRLK